MSNNNAASVTDGKLILTFPNAVSPVVWQMDIEKATSCAFEIQEDKKKKCFDLIQKSDAQEKTVIASFEDKDTAVKALMSASTALQSGSGRPDKQKSSHTDNNAATKKTGGEGKTVAILSVFLIVLLIIVWMVSVPIGKNNLSEQMASYSEQSTSSSSNAAGVPVSADDFLNNR